MAVAFYPVLALVHVLLLLWSISIFEPGPGFVSLIAVQLTVVYDNAIVAIGSRLGHGPVLHGLNRGRFLLHAAVTPLLVLTAFGQARLAHLAPIAWTLAVLFAGVGLGTGFVGKKLIPVCHQGVKRYALSVNETNRCPDIAYTAEQLNARALPPIQSILTVLVIFSVGMYLAITVGQWAMLGAALVMLVAGALPPRKVGVIPQALSEVLMLVVLIRGFA